jgi:hypothetical protein
MELRGLGINDDGTILTLMYLPPHQIAAIGLTPTGREVFRTILSGANGRGPGKVHAQKWLLANGELATSGKEFAVHFGHFLDTKGPTHQGGCFARLDEKGNKLQYNGWTVSHSLDQALLYQGEQWLTTSVGDVFPKGIPFIHRSQKKSRSLLYPPPDQKASFQPKATRIGNMVAVGEDAGVIFATRVAESWQAYYVVADRQGEVKRFVKLLDGMGAKHARAYLAPYGPNLLLIWTDSDTTTRYAPIDHTGRLLGQSTLVDAPLGMRNDLARFANGDVGWLTAIRGASEVTLVRLRR